MNVPAKFDRFPSQLWPIACSPTRLFDALIFAMGDSYLALRHDLNTKLTRISKSSYLNYSFLQSVFVNFDFLWQLATTSDRLMTSALRNVLLHEGFHPAHVCSFLWFWFTYNPYPTAFPYGNGMVLHFYQQQENSTTKTVHKVINKGLKTYV